jgi:hypothetical protein
MPGSKITLRRFDNYDYASSPEFKKYLKEYGDFLLEHKDEFEMYVGLDIINNPPLTHKNTLYLRKLGLNPIPVFHLGCDPKWLRLYIEESDYIGLGGMRPATTPQLIPVLDSFWTNYLLDDKGFPLVKVHGLAMTSHKLMLRYPWYSVDSASAVKAGGYGKIFLPRIIKGKPDYTHLKSIAVSDVSFKLRKKGFESLPKKDSILYQQELDTAGFDIKTLSVSHMERAVWNMLVMSKVAASAPPWPWAMKKSKGFGL